MNRISGRITVKESGVGIPDLLVVMYDLDPGTQPEEILGRVEAGTTGISTKEIPGDRLATVTTQRGQPELAGTFELKYEDSEFQIRNEKEKRPDLFLMVLAPEELGTHTTRRLPLVVTAIRQNAGRIEEFLIRLSTEQLEKAGIPLPTVPDSEREDTGSLLLRLTNAAERDEKVLDGVREIAKKRVLSARALISGFQTKVKPALQKKLSRVPEQLRDPTRFVAPGESVLEKSSLIIRRGIEQTINSDDPKKNPPVQGFVTLTDAERDALQAQADASGLIPAEALEAVLVRNRGQGTTTFVLREDPLAFCLEKTTAEKECADLILGDVLQEGGNGSPPEDGNIPGRGVERVTAEDIPRYIARLMDSMTSPEEDVVTGLTPQATRDTVQQDIQALSLQRSPADVPALHDFHNLQIAFEHVWQEALDEGVLNLAEEAYETIVELGGEPDRDETTVGRNPIGVLVKEGRSVLRAHRVVDHRREADNVRDHRHQADNVRDGRSVRDHRTGSGNVRDHRGVSGHVRDHRRESPDPLERLPELLAELERRLKADYAFTIYAANRKERSVNFGILVTYRQVWTPLSYQAGPLIKSVPLAPKQTQKLVVTHKRSKKRAQKEVENNLRSVREESTQTSRAEQEIIRRASVKTDFSLTSDGTYKFGGGGTTVTTKFTREASKSSDDIKKSFHEAVFKAAQEFKQERTTEINVEEAEEFESIETTEISNPNDEVAVTFLFYELQRRYRVTERIHSVTPVVLVAQEVPEPHEIDEDWLIAHDWILRRVLLDDSFLPALNYLAQSVVGDEVALTEMRRNVEQQRRIVDELREELTAARQRATLQRALLERAVYQKAGVLDVPRK